MTTKKLAIFVEGQTEQIFLKSFVEQIAGEHRVELITSTGKENRLMILRTGKVKAAQDKYIVLLVDCAGDERVKSTILDQRDSLMAAGYSLVLGLRDLYPKEYKDISVVKKNMKYGIPTKGLPIHILLAVEEVEAWFIKEYSHFKKIDSRLNPKEFKIKFGFDPSNENAEAIRKPAALLNKIYQSVGKAYKKDRITVSRTVNVLDYAALYLDIPESTPHLAEFVDHIENFFE